MIIDFHTHVLSPQIRERREEYLKKDACFALLYSNPKATLASAEDIINAMDTYGVDKSVILNLGWVSHEMCVQTNDYILESVAKFPDRLIGFAAIQPLAGDMAIEELRRCARYGVKGIGEMRMDIQGFNLNDYRLMKPIAEFMISNNLIFLTHSSEPVGHWYIGKGEITPDILYRFIVSFPGLKVVCAHWGGGLPFYALMPEVNKSLTNVFFDTAATPFLYNPLIVKRVSEIVGSNKILFGSDYPLLSPKRVVDDIKGNYITKADTDKILGDNARQLLQI